jgi:hypothetical protein
MIEVLGMSESEMRAVIPLIAIGGGLIVGVVAIVTSAVTKVAQTKAREESRREIAAYVAEGTISPDDATRMLNAGSLAGHIDQFKQKLKV